MYPGVNQLNLCLSLCTGTKLLWQNFTPVLYHRPVWHTIGKVFCRSPKLGCRPLDSVESGGWVFAWDQYSEHVLQQSALLTFKSIWGWSTKSCQKACNHGYNFSNIWVSNLTCILSRVGDIMTWAIKNLRFALNVIQDYDLSSSYSFEKSGGQHDS